MNDWIEPFNFEYMRNAILVCSIVGVVCAALSAYLVLKGWSLMGDALAHAIVPGVAISYLLSLPYATGAFFAGFLAAISMWLVKRKTALREDAVIGIVFTTFLCIGLVIASINPTSINLNTIILGNALSISNTEVIQVLIICAITSVFLFLFWRDWFLIFFDISQAKVCSLPIHALQILFFTLLSATIVAALQTVGAALIIAIVITPGATAYLLTNRFSRLLVIAMVIGFTTSWVGAYASYFLNVPPGSLIVTLQTLLFLITFVFAPQYGLLAKRRTNTLVHDA